MSSQPILRPLTSDEIDYIVKGITANEFEYRNNGKGYTFIKIKVPGATKLVREVNANELRGFYRAQLTGVKIVPEAIEEYKSLVLQSIHGSFSQAGDNVGATAVASLYLPLMQANLDARHHSGSGKQLESTSKRMDRILNVSVNTNPSMKIYFKDTRWTLDQLLSHRKYIEEATLSKLSTTFYISRTDELENLNNEMTLRFMDLYDVDFSELIGGSIYSMVVELNPYQLYIHGLTPVMIATKINSLYHRVGSPKLTALPIHIEGDDGIPVYHIYLVINASTAGDMLDETDEEEYGKKSHNYINSDVRPKLVEKYTLDGIAGIDRVYPSKMPLSAFVDQTIIGEFPIEDEVYNVCVILKVFESRNVGIDAERYVMLFNSMLVPATLDSINGELSDYIFYVKFKLDEANQNDNFVSHIFSQVNLARISGIVKWEFEPEIEETETDVILRSPYIEDYYQILNYYLDNEMDLSEDTLTIYDISNFKQKIVDIAHSLLYVYSMITEGSNLNKVCQLSFVNSNVTQTDNFHEILASLGIEAFRKALIYELNDIVMSVKPINQHHIELFMDRMCYKGAPLAVTASGLDLSESSKLELAAKEKATSNLAKEAMYGTTERTNQTVAATIFADRANVGTGKSADVLIDREMLKELYGEDEANRIIQEMITQRPALAEKPMDEAVAKKAKFVSVKRREPTIRASVVPSTGTTTLSEVNVIRAATSTGPQRAIESSHVSGTYVLYQSNAGNVLNAPITDYTTAPQFINRVGRLLWGHDMKVLDTTNEPEETYKYHTPDFPKGDILNIPNQFMDELDKMPNNYNITAVNHYTSFRRVNPMTYIHREKLGSNHYNYLPGKLHPSKTPKVINTNVFVDITRILG